MNTYHGSWCYVLERGKGAYGVIEGFVQKKTTQQIIILVTVERFGRRG